MNGYRIDVEQAILWFRSKANLLKDTGVSMAEVHASATNVPSARADFDSEERIGRISIWASGEIDFEVLRSDGEFALFHHESVNKLQTSAVDRAYGEFLKSMKGTGSA